MQLILVRHPQPLIAPGVCYGRSDLAVAPEQLAQTLAALTATLPRGRPIYSSPLQRCATLATQLAAPLQSAPPLFDARIAEIDFGDWELRPWDDIPRADIDAWAADLVHYRPGGGESVLQMACRIAAFHADLQRQQRDAIIICHAGAMRLLSASHAGLAPADMAMQAAQNPHQIAYGATLTLQS
ncbi:histidine phosphatase family protein [Duganella sp. HH105]|uniref:histidine phosphatase family protein n=1 Tax=Duganella sp. HH105 TaxID=1781067 RepID=UPI000877E514|nr:histidine phosphatase family protein [Duganella sp. HH105]OEZ52220.1 bifunctional RNase H/acid phosphatase [Duganella sp. HH105]